MPLKKGLDNWSNFVELCERRNLLVHSGGIISRRYLQVCVEHGVQISENLKPGVRLEVSPSYYRESSRCL
jgi:hypothetical protein